MDKIKYLKLLAKSYGSISQTVTQIVNLEAILNLPKGTEHFMTDLHGEYESFDYILRNGSGNIIYKIDEVFGDTVSDKCKKELATIIYYPKEKIEYLEKKGDLTQDTLIVILNRLIKVCRVVASKYTRAKVTQAMDSDFSYILQELLYEREVLENKREYYHAILKTIVEIKRSKEFIISISNLIQTLNIDHLHIIGDIYDRGPYPHMIMDKLKNYHNVDIQWGNHDMLWIGAALGNEACICNAIRISCRYNTNEVLQDAYGINLLPLAEYAMKYYENDPCTKFMPKEGEKSELLAKMHKAISVLQFKLEAIYSKRNPDFGMQNRELIDRINFDTNEVLVDGKWYKLNDTYFPTIDKNEPSKLNEDEIQLMKKLKNSFKQSEKLQEHMRVLFTKGSMYLAYNSNLLFHACIPMTEDGNFAKVTIEGYEYSGKAYLDKIDKMVRICYHERKQYNKNRMYIDYLWYLWSGKYSPLFGKEDMRTFERYFIDDKITHKEKLNAYHTLVLEKETTDKIFKEFGLDPEKSYIVNGHIPVKVKKGESPVKGRLLMIDGGFLKAYQKETGIAGYTLISNSHTMRIITHNIFRSKEEIIENDMSYTSCITTVENAPRRIRVKDTDLGKEISDKISDLRELLEAYRQGIIKVES